MAVLYESLQQHPDGKGEKIIIVDDDYTMSVDDRLVLVDTQQGQPKITLPKAIDCIGKNYVIANSGTASGDSSPGPYDVYCQDGDDMLFAGLAPITDFTGKQEFVAVKEGHWAVW